MLGNGPIIYSFQCLFSRSPLSLSKMKEIMEIVAFFSDHVHDGSQGSAPRARRGRRKRGEGVQQEREGRDGVSNPPICKASCPLCPMLADQDSGSSAWKVLARQASLPTWCSPVFLRQRTPGICTHLSHKHSIVIGWNRVQMKCRDGNSRFE